MSLNITPPDIQYGDVFWAHVPGYGSDKPRPWLVISDNVQNKGNDIMMIPLTSHTPSAMTNATVQLTVKGKQSYAKCGHIMTVKKDILGAWEEQVSPATMQEILKGIEAARTNLKPVRSSKSKQQSNPIDDILEWEDVISQPVDQQISYLNTQLKQFTTQELTAHWGIHHQAIYARINKIGQKLSARNKQVPQPPVNLPAPSTHDFDLCAELLGAYLLRLIDPKKKYYIQLKEM